MIITTAIPRITDDFNSVTDIGWYGSAYLLTTCAFQLLFGKLYSIYSIKATVLTTIFLFEVGSALCGASSELSRLHRRPSHRRGGSSRNSQRCCGKSRTEDFDNLYLSFILGSRSRFHAGLS